MNNPVVEQLEFHKLLESEQPMDLSMLNFHSKIWRRRYWMNYQENIALNNVNPNRPRRERWSMVDEFLFHLKKLIHYSNDTDVDWWTIRSIFNKNQRRIQWECCRLIEKHSNRCLSRLKIEKEGRSMHIQVMSTYKFSIRNIE